MAKIPVGLAIGIVWNEFNNSCIDTLKKISEIGYKGIEPTAASPIPLNEYVKALEDFDLKVTSTHTLLDDLEKDFNRYVEFNDAVGCNFIVCPWILEEQRKNEDDYHRFAARLNEAGAKCKEKGLQLCYHNHQFEFIKYNGKYAFDILFDETDRDLVQSELDTYWVKYADENPAEYVRRYKTRLPLLHLKDMDKGSDRTFAEVGEGIIDFNAIYNEVDSSTLKWLLVEQDTTKKSPFDSIRISFENLKKMGIA